MRTESGLRFVRIARRAFIAAALGVALLPMGATPVAAQPRPGLEIRLPDPAFRATDGPLVRLLGAVSERELRELLDHGFPIRVHYRIELWTKTGWFDDLRGSEEWDVLIRFDPLRRSYGVARIVGDQVTPLGEFGQHAEAVQAAERPYRSRLVAPRGKRAYYLGVVDIETLSLSDLEEVERWLRGELRPAVRGERNPGTALGRGLRSLATHLLGSESRHYETRSGTFKP